MQPSAAQCPLWGREERGLGSGTRRVPARDLLSVRSIVHVLAAVAAEPQPQGSSVVSVCVSSTIPTQQLILKVSVFLLEKAKNYSPRLRCKGAYVNYERQKNKFMELYTSNIHYDSKIRY